MVHLAVAMVARPWSWFLQCTVHHCLIDSKRSRATTASCSLSKTLATGI